MTALHLGERFDCRAAKSNTPAAWQRAEEWVRTKLKAFHPSPEEALRMLRLEEKATQVFCVHLRRLSC